MTVLTAIAAADDQPSRTFEALGRLAQDVSGARLVTLMTFDAATREAGRVWTSDALHYPVAGTKAAEDTIWTRTVLDRHETFVANTIDGIRKVFPDHDLIASLGCASCMNLPFVAMGRVLGTANILDAEGYFTPDRIAAIDATLRLPGLAAFLLNETLKPKGTS